MTPSRPLHAAVMASGSGSNFQALIDAERRRDEIAPWTIRLLISDRSTSGALERARAAGIHSKVIRISERPADEIAEDTLSAFEERGIEVVFLAGYLRLIPERVVQRYRGRMLNVHPALLPAFGGQGMWGRRVHEAVLASGARITGPTVHLVDEHYDEGRILGQWPVPVRAGDTADTLAARVLAAEHQLYPRVAASVCRDLAAGRPVAPLDEGDRSFQLVPEPHLP